MGADAEARAGNARPVPSGTLLLKDISVLATMDDTLGEISGAALYIEGNEIKWVGKMAELPEDMRHAREVLDMSGHIVIPGIINTHHHMFQSLTRNIAQETKLFGWLTTLYNAWQHLTGDDVYTACRLAMVELIMSGCTTSADHLYIYPNDVTLEDSIRAAREVGMRFHPTRGAMTLGQSKGGLPPDCCCEDEDACLADMERLIRTFHDNSRLSMLKMSLAPCAPFNVTTELMVRSAQLARRFPGVRLHTHLAENQEDIDFSLSSYGCRPGEYIKRVGWDRDDVWFAHCCMLDTAERQLFADRGIAVAHCPSSNLRLASGIAPVRGLLDTGVTVGLGVDGSASNDAGHALAEARLMCLLQRAGGSVAGMAPREALAVATRGGAVTLGRGDALGRLAPGFAADLVAWRTDTLGFAGSLKDPVAALINCTASIGFVDLSIINGRIVVKDGTLQTADMQELIRAHNACSLRICNYLPPWWRSGNEG